jgi:uncharacterized protein YceH (UPF0502 family)
MDVSLSANEVRVLGALIEKQLTTPEYYPLSLNALTAACNQKTNRDPVMTLDDSMVVRTLDSLRGKRLAWKLDTAGGRVPKFEHNLVPRWPFSEAEVALICVLLLRGAQTPGELRIRTERMHEFASLEDIEQTLSGLASNEKGPFVIHLSRKPGEKESRWMHLFAGLPAVDPVATNTTANTCLPAQETSAESSMDSTEIPQQIRALESKVDLLQQELQMIKKAFDEFVKKFE